VMHRSVGTLNIASGHSVSFRSVAELIAAGADRAVVIEPSPRQNPTTHRQFDIINVIRAFPGTRFTPLRDGLTATFGAIAETGGG
jgi:hypothetical protein